MANRKFFLPSAYVATVAVFIVAKLVFVLCNGAGHGVTAAILPDILLHGLTLDLSTALYVLLPPFLWSAAAVWAKVPQWPLKAWFAIVSIALALAFVADTSLYPFWGFKLDASCLQYLDTPGGITASVSTPYLLIRLAAIIITATLIYSLYALCLSLLGRQPLSPQLTTAKKAIATVAHLAAIPLIVIGLRGGTGESTTNIGQAYFSQNQFLNHCAVNPVFSFLYSLSHQMGDLSQYHFMGDEEARQLTTGVYTTESVATPKLLTTNRPTVVVILLESAGEQFSHAMPHLQQLKQEGINFSQCYANSWRTDRGTVCTLSGYPSFPSLSVMKMPEKSRTLPSLARTLSNEGYATHYIYGGDINFTNMRSYLVATGWQTLTSQDDYPREERNTARWGVRDDITFSTVESLITSGNTPQLIGFSTLSSHEPWDVPTSTMDDEVDNAFAYLDDCLYSFIERLRKSPAWENLLIVLTADHGINHDTISQQTPLEKHHIPMLWLGGAIRQPQAIATLCNQSDLCATLLAQIGLPHADFTFSRDILSRTYSHPVAVNNSYNMQWIIDDTGNALYDFDAHRFTLAQATDSASLLQLNKAMLQLTTEDLKAR